MSHFAIYPGSFDPITNGHLDIIHRASQVFDSIIIAVIQNPDKQNAFSLQERISLIKEVMGDRAGIQVEGFEGLLVDFAQRHSIFTIIRGLRALSDFDYEFQMALTNRQLCAKIDTVFFMTDERYAYLSSSVVRQVARFGGDVSAFVPEAIRVALQEKWPHA